MKLVHSLWSKPLLSTTDPVERSKKIITTLWCYASSVAYAKKHKLPIRLYADEVAADMLRFLPYDDILPMTVPENIPTNFWAAGKFAAYAEMKEGDVHIDGDVFLQSAAVVALLKEAVKKYDLTVQCIETPTNCCPLAYDMVNGMMEAHGITYKGEGFGAFEGAFNTGLISFGDLSLRDEYVRNYLRSVGQVAEKESLVKLLRAANTVPDIVLEQQKLFELAKEKRVFSLLGSGQQSVEYSRVLGYMHILADAKWENMDKIIGQLWAISPEIFGKTADSLNKILV